MCACHFFVFVCKQVNVKHIERQGKRGGGGNVNVCAHWIKAGRETQGVKEY